MEIGIDGGEHVNTAAGARTLASLRSFYMFMVQNGNVSVNPTLNLEAPHVEKKMPQILSGREVEILLEQPNVTDNKGMRDKAMLELLYATGIIFGSQWGPF